MFDDKKEEVKPVRDYLHRPGEKLLPKLIIYGCIAITAALVYSAFKTHSVGAKLNPGESRFMDSEGDLLAP